MKTWRAVGKSSYQHGEQTKTIIGLEISYQTQMAIKILRREGGFTYLLIKPYPFLTLNHLTVPKTFVAAMRHKYTTFNGVKLSVSDAPWR